MSATLCLSEVLADASVFTDGDWVESKDQDPDGDVRLTQLADVGDGFWIDKSSRFLTSAKAQKLRCTYLEPGDVLVARMPDPLGRACIFPGDDMPCVTVVDVCIIRPNPERVFNRYLMHAINSPRGRNGILQHVTGTTRQRISRKNLAKLEIPLPPFPEQKRIAKILDAADALRAKRRESLAQLDALLQSTFLEMFGDPVENPKGWPCLELKDLGKITTGKTPPTKKPGMFHGALPFATPSDLDSDLEATARTLTDAGARYTKVVRAGSTLVGCIGNIGKMAKTPVDTAFNQQINAIEWGEKIDDDFGLSALSHCIPQMLSKASSTTVPILNKSGFSSVQMIVPPIDQQRKFSRFVGAKSTQSRVMRSQLLELDHLFVSLQQRAFAGQL